MDNCFTGWHDVRKRRPVKLPAGPVTECAFARWRKVYHFLSGHNDVIASFSFGAKECADVFQQRYVFEVLQRTLPFYFISSSTNYLYYFSDHQVVSWTEMRFLWARYGPIRQPQEMRALS